MHGAAAWPLPPIVAHRCGGALAPENTLVGLDVAAAQGCRGVEFDVMLSADGVPLLIHDETLERTTDGCGRVAATSAAALRGLDAGAWFAPRFAGERLPTLDEALARCTTLDLAVNIEIKPSTGHDAATGRAVGHCLRQNWRSFAPGLLLSSFSPVALLAAAEQCPEYPRGLLVEHIPADWQARCIAVGAIALHADTRHVDEALTRTVRAAGYRLALYTENDMVRIARLLSWGVDSIITDNPGANYGLQGVIHTP